MSNEIFPALPGLTWDRVKTPSFSTSISKAASGREIRVAYMASPMYTFKLVHEFLRDKMTTQNPTTPYNEFRLLAGFFNARQGSFDSFLFDDNTDNSATAQQFGTGDGTTTSFQLGRIVGGGTGGLLEPVMNINGTPTIYKAGVATTAFTLGSTGVVTFSSAPASGVALSWTGGYYFRVRFETDSTDFAALMLDLWENGGINLYGSLSNKI